jgi:NADH:ubiquinone oxidoreductase subunit K
VENIYQIVCIALALFLFSAGVFALLFKRSLFAIILSLELFTSFAVLLSAWSFITYGGDERNEILALFIVFTSAVELILALSIVITATTTYRNKSLSLSDFLKRKEE